MEKPRIYTPADLGAIAEPNKKEESSGSGFNLGVIQEINKGISGLNQLLSNWQSAKTLIGQATGGTPESPQNIQTKIEKGVDQRMRQAQSSTEPQREPKIAIHVGNATKEFIGFTELIFGSLDDNLTIGEAKEQLKENMSEETITPIVQSFLEKHTEVYLE